MRIRWTDELIEAGIWEVVDCIGEKRMPTNKEMKNYYGNGALAAQITTKGGCAAWANKLGLPLKTNSVTLAWGFEKHTQGLLEGRGYDVERCRTKDPYDLLINGKVKIDVKVSHLVMFEDTPGYAFEIGKNRQNCDIYIAYCLGKDDEIIKTYIIPAHILSSVQQLTVGEHRSKYDKYVDRWDLIDKVIDSFAALEVC